MSLEEFRRQLLDSKAELERRLTAIEQDVRNETNPVSKDSEERSIEQENDEVIDALGNAARDELRMINRALKRIESGVYLDCAECGNPIGEERLMAIPYTDHCVRCAKGAEN